MKRLTSELSLDELLKSLEKVPDEKEESNLEYKNDILGFLNFFKIKQVDEYIHKHLLRKIYTQWSTDPIPAKQFYTELNYYFKQHGYRGYMINQNAINLSSSAYRYYSDKRKVDKIKSPSWKRHFDSFLNFYQIKSGKTWVPWFALYHLYDRWTYNNKAKSILSEMNFIAFLNLYFKRKRKNDYYWFCVHSDVYQKISPESIMNIMEAREKRVKEKGRQNAKGQRAVSSFKTRTKSKN